MRVNLIAFAAGMLSLCIAGTTDAQETQAKGRAHSQTKAIRWDRSTLTLIAERAGYGRMISLTSGDILCAFGRRGNICTSRSSDDGKTWSTPKMVIKYEFATAANPELLELANGRIVLSYNERPRDGKHHFTIRTCISKDVGETWTAGSLVYRADTRWPNGCWEPSQIQLPSGEIQLYFANENPYRRDYHRRHHRAVGD